MNQELFKSNKYSSWYFSIINKALNRKGDFEGEKHHIVPKCMGGKDVVKLTLREHYICHLLLPKMVINAEHIKKMYFALWLIINCTHTVNSHTYTKIRSHAINEMKKYRKGRKKSPKAVVNMSMSRLNKTRSEKAIQGMKRGCKPPSRKGIKYSAQNLIRINFLKKANKTIKSFCPLYKYRRQSLTLSSVS